MGVRTTSIGRRHYKKRGPREGTLGHATEIDLDQHVGNFRKRLKKIRVLIQVKKAVKMS